MVDLDEKLKCEEHEAPYLIGELKAKQGKYAVACEFVTICPVDQMLNTISLEIPNEELEDLYMPLADKIFRCEKCFREATIDETVIDKKVVTVYLSCPEHGRLINRGISPVLYDKIRFVWDMKDVEKKTIHRV